MTTSKFDLPIGSLIWISYPDNPDNVAVRYGSREHDWRYISTGKVVDYDDLFKATWDIYEVETEPSATSPIPPIDMDQANLDSELVKCILDDFAYSRDELFIRRQTRAINLLKHIREQDQALGSKRLLTAINEQKAQKTNIVETDGAFLARVGTDGALWASEMVKHKRFAYLDETPGGDLHGWLCSAIEAGKSAGYSDAKAEKTLFEDDGFLTIGDDCFLSPDGSLISYQDQEYLMPCGERVNHEPGGNTYCVKHKGHVGRIHEDLTGNWMLKDSEIVRHGKYELDILGEDEWTHTGLIKMLMIFAEMGHSGGSAPSFINMLVTLLKQKELSALTDNPEEWIFYRPDQWDGVTGIWQNRRNSTKFSNDGGRRFYRMDDLSTHEDKARFAEPTLRHENGVRAREERAAFEAAVQTGPVHKDGSDE